MRQFIRRLRCDQQGYTLVVIAALFAAFAVVGTTMLDREVALQPIKRQADTADAMRRLAGALNTYTAFNSGRLPCPAQYNLAATDQNFGSAIDDCHTGTSTGMDVLTGSAMVRGMVPVRELVPYGIDVNDAYDAFGNRIMFVVDRQLTTDGTGTASAASNRATVTDPNLGIDFEKPDYLLVSYGRDHMGATQRGQTTITLACTTTTPLREENCDSDLTFYKRPQVIGNNVSSATYFDDLVMPVVLSPYNAAAPVNAGAAYCWGAGTTGAVGNGSSSSEDDPKPVSGGLTFKAISSSYQETHNSTNYNHTCGITTAGAAYCWGTDYYHSSHPNYYGGALGRGVTGNGAGGSQIFNTPQPVSGSNVFTSITTGHQSACALNASGAAYCWGINPRGQLGNNNNPTASNVPVAVNGGFTFTKLSSSYMHVCGITSSGAAYCWGEGGGAGNSCQLGNNDVTCSDQPAPGPSALVHGGHTWTDIAAGMSGTCGIASSGQLYCWGYNAYGEGGYSSTGGQSHTPYALPGAAGFAGGQIASGRYFNCALTSAGVAYCWGWNNVGQLGIGSTDGSVHYQPSTVTGGHTFTKLSPASRDTMCGLKADGTLYCWGACSMGECGSGSTPGAQSTPVLVTNGYLWNNIGQAGNTVCALRKP